jgi:GMP synthase-like glutamine amidotransferase
MGTGLSGPSRTPWLEYLEDAGIELRQVPESAPSLRAPGRGGGPEAFLILGVPRLCAPGAGVQDGADLGHLRREREYVRFARSRRLPVVGVGHGAGYLALYFGGRLRPAARTPGRVLFFDDPGSAGPAITSGDLWTAEPTDFPEPLRPLFVDEQGGIAGFTHESEPILGIHWHPESPADPAVGLILDTLQGTKKLTC